MSEINRSELKAVETEINAEKERIKNLEKKKNQPGGLSTDDQIELNWCEDTLADLKKKEKYWADLIRIQTKDDFEPESKPFKEADAGWTRSVTGIDTDYHEWAPPLDGDIRPSETFKSQFEDTASFIHMKNEAGRRFFLNLFLLDIVKRAEFGGLLKIFTEIPMEVTQSIGDGTKKRRLGGIIDYAVGLNVKELDMFDKAPPKELHLIAIEAKVEWGTDDFWQCVAETATLFKARKDAGKAKCRVWGMLSNAKLWQFIFINEDGILHQTGELSLNLHVYREVEIAKVPSGSVESIVE